jgi:transmembrane sensor
MPLPSAPTPDDLAADASFVRWVLQTDPDATAAWEAWLRQSPTDRAERVRQARLLVLATQQHFGGTLPDELVRTDLRRLLDRAEATPAAGRVVRLPFRRWWVPAAAVLALLVGVGWYLRSGDLRLGGGRADDAVAEIRRAAPGERLRVEQNTTGQPRTLVLSDGSTVLLDPGSTLTYATPLGQAERVVHLSGAAFFDIARNPDRPFLVYTRHAVTRVLGTSFRIRAEDDGPTQVVVRTGRVRVYPKERYQPDDVTAGVELLPRQQITLTDDDGALPPKQAVAPSVRLTPVPQQAEMSYDNQPLPLVLRGLMRAYQAPIEFDETALASCRITTTFVDESLTERLTSICEAIGATLEVRQDRFIVRSQGCPP